MDIQQEWNNLTESKFSGKISNEQILNAIYCESSSSTSKLNKGLLIKGRWALLFIVIFSLGMAGSYAKPEAVLILGVVDLFYIIGYLQLRFARKQLDMKFGLDNNILSTLKSNVLIVKTALSRERKSVLLFMPSMIFCGIALPKIYFGESLVVIFTNTTFLVTMILALLVSAPIVYFLGKKLNDIAFGGYLEKLRKNINKLELLNDETK